MPPFTALCPQEQFTVGIFDEIPTPVTVFLMTNYAHSEILEAAPDAATEVPPHFGTTGVQGYLGPAPENHHEIALPYAASCLFSCLCGGRCKKPVVNGEVGPSAKYAAMNQELDGVQIEGDAKVDKHRKRWVYVYCQHCGRHRRKVRLDSLRRKAKVGPDEKLRKAAMSCGCLSKKAFRRNVAAMAVHVPFNTKLKIWTAMKLGRNTAAVAIEYGVSRWVAGFVAKELGKLAFALRKESRVGEWATTCGSLRQLLDEEGITPELSFHWQRGPKGDRKRGKWVCDMQSEVKRAQKILKRWAYFKASPVKAVREIMDLASWTVGAYRSGRRRLANRISRNGNRLTKAEMRKHKVDRLCNAFENRMDAEGMSVEEARLGVSQLVTTCNELLSPGKVSADDARPSSYSPRSRAARLAFSDD